MLKKHWVGIGLGLVLALVGVKALADYLGPDRTVTVFVWQRQLCQYRADLLPPRVGSCSLTLYYPPNGCPAVESVAGYFNPGPLSCGSSWPGACGSGVGCNLTQTQNETISCNAGETGCTQVPQEITFPPCNGERGVGLCHSWGWRMVSGWGGSGYIG